MSKKKSNKGWFYILKAVCENGDVIYKDGFTKVSVKDRQYRFNSEIKVKSEIIFAEKVKNPSQVQCDFKYKWHWNFHKSSSSEAAMIETAEKICDLKQFRLVTK